jgi:RNA polymerase sigma-70 factor, ECF subfamily
VVGRDERFEELYRAHAGAVRSYVARRIGPDEADDAVAEVFLVVWRRLDDVPVHPLPWLLGIGRRVLANRHRGHARRAALTAKLQTVGTVAASSTWAVSDPDDWVLRALSTLPALDQEVLLLVAWEGLDAVRAARALGVRKGTFLMRLHRARRRFARAVADQTATDRDRNPRADVPEVSR